MSDIKTVYGPYIAGFKTGYKVTRNGATVTSGSDQATLETIARRMGYTTTDVVTLVRITQTTSVPGCFIHTTIYNNQEGH